MTEITEIEKEAYRLAARIVAQAGDEQWSYLCLSPFDRGTGAVRYGMEALADLNRLPHGIERLRTPIFIELRGTNIADVRPLKRAGRIGAIWLKGIPACQNDERLRQIAEIEIDVERVDAFQQWLDLQEPVDPPEIREGGPEFQVGETGPITLRDLPLTDSSDDDQAFLQNECRRKASALNQIAETAANIAPSLPGAVQSYFELMSQEASQIGARSTWSLANSLEAVLEIHEIAVEQHNHSNELPSNIAVSLKDLAETHRVWFLGHPGAREVFERASRHSKPERSSEILAAATAVVEAAEKSPHVAPEATLPARANISIAELNTPSGIAAYGELEDWVWNFVATVLRKSWTALNANPLGPFPTAIAATYVLEFIATNEPAIKNFAVNVMSQGPIWWDALCTAGRKHLSRAKGSKD